MIDQTIIMVDRWLRDPVYGLAPMMEALPTPIHDEVFIYNEVESEELAREEGAIRHPAVMVLATPNIEYEPNDRFPANIAKVKIAILFAAGTEKPLLETSRFGGRVLRAVAKSLKRLGINKFRESRSFESLEDVEIVTVDTFVHERIAGAIAGVSLSGAITATVQVKDHNP